jgi:hypothetical protein
MICPVQLVPMIAEPEGRPSADRHATKVKPAGRHKAAEETGRIEQTQFVGLDSHQQQNATAGLRAGAEERWTTSARSPTNREHVPKTLSNFFKDMLSIGAAQTKQGHAARPADERCLTNV